ncbi:MAG: aminopeptidase [Xanthomonadaceae bacterium]|nr:aminopeptidase [Xanthomonadaceae bacterium]
MIVFLGVLLLSSGGCATLGWYGQAARGQMELLIKRKNIEKLIAAPDTPEERRHKLELVLELREFADKRLGLPDNGSYSGFVELDRDAVVYNVIAAPTFSVVPKIWCYPLVGCLAYRGYFRASAADQQAAQLKADGYDVVVSPVAAYSTLGRFNDPVTSPMLKFSDVRLAGLLFHELAHQRVFVKGETAFNEAYASSVENAGIERWLARDPSPERLEQWRHSRTIEDAFTDLLLLARRDLEALYQRNVEHGERAKLKRQSFAKLQSDYADFRKRHDSQRFDAYMQQDLNNAHLALLATYRAGTDAFDQLLAEYRGNFERFHQAVERLAGADQEVRARFLNCQTGTCP